LWLDKSQNSVQICFTIIVQHLTVVSGGLGKTVQNKNCQNMPTDKHHGLIYVSYGMKMMIWGPEAILFPYHTQKISNPLQKLAKQMNYILFSYLCSPLLS